MARVRQYQAFVIGAHELAEHLKLPRDHRIVRIEPTEPHLPPGITVIIEGLGGFVTPLGGAVYHHHFYERWRDEEVDIMREAALKQYGPYEW